MRQFKMWITQQYVDFLILNEKSLGCSSDLKIKMVLEGPNMGALREPPLRPSSFQQQL